MVKHKIAKGVRLVRRYGKDHCICQCYCGRRWKTRYRGIKYGKIKSCGCTHPRRNVWIPGKTKNGLTLIRRLGKVKGRFQCHCGKRFTTRFTSVSSGLTTSCGCLWMEARKRQQKYRDGDKLGRIKLLKRLNGGHGQSGVFKCYCGNTFESTIALVASKQTQSCGCLHRQTMKKVGVKQRQYNEGSYINGKKLLKRTTSNHTTSRAIFECECGRSFETTISKIVTGHTSSCGCRRYKGTRHYRGIRYRNSWEVVVAAALHKAGIRFFYEYQRFDLGTAGKYLPDFFLPDLGVFIEVKGQKRAAGMLKCKRFARKYPTLLMDKSALSNLYGDILVAHSHSNRRIGAKVKPLILKDFALFR